MVVRPLDHSPFAPFPIDNGALQVMRVVSLTADNPRHSATDCHARNAQHCRMVSTQCGQHDTRLTSLYALRAVACMVSARDC